MAGEEDTFLACLVCVRVRRAQCLGCGYRTAGDCGVCVEGGQGAWSLREQGTQSPDRSQARVHGPRTIPRQALEPVKEKEDLNPT